MPVHTHREHDCINFISLGKKTKTEVSVYTKSQGKAAKALQGFQPDPYLP